MWNCCWLFLIGIQSIPRQCGLWGVNRVQPKILLAAAIAKHNSVKSQANSCLSRLFEQYRPCHTKEQVKSSRIVVSVKCCILSDLQSESDFDTHRNQNHTDHTNSMRCSHRCPYNVYLSPILFYCTLSTQILFSRKNNHYWLA